MSELEVVGGKTPSQVLRVMIKDAADSLGDFVFSYSEAIERGKQEDFNEQEIQMLIRPLLQKRLETQGLDKIAIKNKIAYLFNRAEEQERARDNREKQKLYVQPINHNNVLEDCSSDWDKSSAMDEIARLHNEVYELNDTIKSMSFEENPDIFRINQADPNSMVFTKLKGSDAIDLVRNDIKKDKFYDIAWKEAV